MWFLPSFLLSLTVDCRVYAESSLPYSFDAPPTNLSPEIFAKLHSLSPIKLVDAVKTPTLLMVGANDRRVPPDQGRAWYHGLKSTIGGRQEEVETEMLWFPGNGHALDSTVEAEVVNFSAGIRFIERFTKF